MADEPSRIVEWCGGILTGWVTVDGTTKKVSANRDIIHQYAAGFSDAVNWEIERHKIEIFEKLIPFFSTAFRNE